MRGVRRAVGAVLDELDVIVAELPEERLDGVERLGVIVVLQRVGGFANHRGERTHRRTVEGDRHIRRIPHGLRRLGHMMVLVFTADGQGELRGVEQLDRQTAANLHLAFVICGVHAGKKHYILL